MAFIKNREAGRFIARLREEAKITQEKLAEDCCCSRSLIQKIEAGESLNEEVFYWALQKMNITDIDYNDLYKNDTLERYRARTDVLLKLSAKRLHAAEKALERYKETCSVEATDKRYIVRNNEKENRQFIMLSERLILAMDGTGWIFDHEDWLSLIHLTIPDYEFGNRIKKSSLSKIEILLFNAYALQLMWDGEYEKSNDLFNEIVWKTSKEGVRGFEYLKYSSMIKVNYAWCLIYKKNYIAARAMLDAAIDHCTECGGIYLLLEIIRVQLFLIKDLEDHALYVQKIFEANILYGFLSKTCRLTKTFEEFLNEPAGALMV